MLTTRYKLYRPELIFSFAKKSHHDVYDAIDPRKGMKDVAKGRSIIVTGFVPNLGV